jgi:protein involved in polysaccharide export with SLBB domain
LADIIRAFDTPAHSDKPAVQLGSIRFEVTEDMRAAFRLRSGRRPIFPFLFAAVALLLGGLLRTVSAQVPLPMQEQVQMFNSLPAAQQQALIQEMQQQLPPAERDAILSALQGGQGLSNQPQQPSQLSPEALSTLDNALRGQPNTERVQEKKPRFKPSDTVVLQFSQRKDTSTTIIRAPDEQQRIDDFQSRLEKGNPYQLDGTGELLLPGVNAIELAGLTVDEATVRVQAETSLKPFTIKLTLLPLEPVGTKALKPFGYDLFEQGRTSDSTTTGLTSRAILSGLTSGGLTPNASGSLFQSPTDIPVPTDYVIGPGDSINVQLFGNQNQNFRFTVSRDGTITFPEIGPVVVAGMTLEQLRDAVSERVSAQMIGVRSSVTLGELRSIRVFVLGDVVKPGSYLVTSLSTMINALYASGGVKIVGSLRNVALMRGGNTVSTLDLYDLLLRGDTRADARLMPGDAIFVPPIGATVAVDGEVRRPAIYEIKGERNVSEVVALAGGLTANANRTNLRLERVVANRGATVQDVDLTGGTQFPVRDGDVLRVLPNLDQMENSVRLAGNVYQPGMFQWTPGMRLTDVLPAPEVVKPKSDLNYVLVRREPSPNVKVDAISADLQQAWQQPNGSKNVQLQPRDTVYVFNLDTGRANIVDPIIKQIEAQIPPNAPFPIVRVGGQVRAAGEYPLEAGMRISDLLRAGGGLSEAAYVTDAELTRYAIVNGEYRETEFVTVDLAGLLKGNSAADIQLTPYDYLNVKEVSRWRGEESITLKGEVVFPGKYPIRRGEKLSSVLARAGGLTDLAFPEGSVFTRTELREREKEQLETLARRVERDLATVSITEPNSSQTITTGQSLVTQLRNSEPTGRLVIRLDDLVRGQTDADIALKDGDQLIVPDQRQEVTVLGEVQYATSHVFERGVTRAEYIDKSGGTTQRADKKRIYVVRANGEVVTQTGGRWFGRDTSAGMRPGDTIVVPLNLSQPLQRWSAITQIVYNLAIAAAAVHSF